MQEESIGKRIQAVRKRAGYTQRQLAQLLFVSESYIALIETDKRVASTGLLLKMSEVLGVSVDYLLSGFHPDSDENLYREWQHLMEGRSPDEIRAAQRIVKEFFDCVDARLLQKSE